MTGPTESVSAIWESADAVRRRWVDADGWSTRVIEAGPSDQDEALVLLHGTGGHAESWARNLVPLAADRRVVALDLIGHGWSDKPLDVPYDYADYTRQLFAALDALGVRRAVLSGLSMGAGVAAHAALAEPGRVIALILTVGIAPIYSSEFGERLYTTSMDAVAAADPAQVRRRLEWLVLDPACITDDLVRLRVAMYQQPDMAEVTHRVLQRIVDPDAMRRNHMTEAMWRRIAQPTLLVTTSDDPGTPYAEIAQVAGWVADGTAVVIDEAGHLPQWEQPEAFNRIHADFLARVW